MFYAFEHIIHTDPNTFWDKLFFDREFNRALFLGPLKYESYRVLEEQVLADGARHLRIACVPKVDVPSALRKIIGNSASYLEVGHFDPVRRRYRAEITPQFGGDKLKSTHEIWVESIEPRRSLRHARGEADVNMFGFKSLLEDVMAKQARDTYNHGAEFTNRWIRDKGLW